MTPNEKYVAEILGLLHRQPAKFPDGEAFMPSNIALVKYWGKRRAELNLPLVSSLSYTLDGYGSNTKIYLDSTDGITLNNKTLDSKDDTFIKVMQFLDLFRAPGEKYRIVTSNNIPTAAGVASSASGYAALTAAIVRLKGWDLPLRAQSMLSRLGSGSACRSFWPGLVLWHKGERVDGMDCYAEPYSTRLSICMAVLIFDQRQKPWSSREAMYISLKTSPLSAAWPVEQQKHLDAVMRAGTDFKALGIAVESDAILLHSVLALSQPPIVFDLQETEVWKKKVQGWRLDGLDVYFTQDAGPNLKLIFPLSIKGKIEEKLRHEGIDYFVV